MRIRRRDGKQLNHPAIACMVDAASSNPPCTILITKR